MKKILVIQNGKKHFLSAQEIYDNIDTTGYEVLINQDTWTVATGVNGTGFGGQGMSVQYEEILYVIFIFTNTGDWEYYESIIPHSVVSQSAFSQREIRFNSNLSDKFLFDNLLTFVSGATQYEPPTKLASLNWNPAEPANAKWIVLRKTIDTNIRYQNITQKNNSGVFAPTKIPLCMNISDYSLSAGQFEKIYQHKMNLVIKDL
ncbi:hypothetical protein [Francisella philomiragia]|uniref:Uncharacterized protein n=1 Tax=Francisella philomiragia TaxID=28110 RepID=A0ABS1GDC8_9GAMM|nr:hypothetical protein [Francisella philomiragia]MBK2259002.1 hypothetical protein [Francisella philomiragia]MBK2302693.1 hypothetical protein [Francisella philomiragia]